VARLLTPVVKSVSFGSRRCEVTISALPHTNYDIDPLCLSFLICEMGQRAFTTGLVH
jgi:hypothetical protein